MEIKIRDFKLNHLPLIGVPNSRYYILSNDETYVTEYVTDKQGQFRRVGIPSLNPDSNITIQDEIPQGIKNGINRIFTTQYNFVPNTTDVWLSGLKRTRGEDNDYVEIAANSIQFNYDIYHFDNILISYKKQ